MIALGDKKDLSFDIVSGESDGISKPLALQASAVNMAGPPALESIATRLPFGSG